MKISPKVPHDLTAKQAEECVKICKEPLMSKVLFTDEKIFTVEPLHNRQNHCQLLKKGQQKTAAAKTIGRSHFSSSVMMWGWICVTGKTPLIFIDRNVKINAASYQQLVLRDLLKPYYYHQLFYNLQWLLNTYYIIANV